MGFFRLYLACCVVNSHLSAPIGFPFLKGGNAVQVFFLISGFYVALILTQNKSYKKSNVFLGYRFSRIFATLWVTLPVIVIMRLPNIIEFYSATEFQLWLVPLWIIINLFAVGSDTLLFLTHKESGFPFAFTSNFALDQSPLYAVLVNPPAWSLPIELGFYVLAPFLFRRKRTRFLVLILSLTLRAVLITKFENSDPWSYRFFPTEIAIFIMGLYLYEFYESIFSKSRGKKISIYLVGPLAAILLANYLVHEKYLKTIPSVVNQVQIISVSILVIPALFYLSRRVKIDKFLGDLSYSVYLLHFGAISLLTYFGFKPNLSMTLLISTTLSALLLPLNQKLEIKLRGSVDRNWGR